MRSMIPVGDRWGGVSRQRLLNYCKPALQPRCPCRPVTPAAHLHGGIILQPVRSLVPLLIWCWSAVWEAGAAVGEALWQVVPTGSNRWPSAAARVRGVGGQVGGLRPLGSPSPPAGLAEALKRRDGGVVDGRGVGA